MTKYRARIEEINARHPVKWWIALGVLLLLLACLSGHAMAYVYRDYTDIVADWTLPSQFSYTTNLYGDTTNYKDIYFYQYSYGASSGDSLIHKISYPTTYWAFTCYHTPLWESADWIDIGWLDSGDAGIISANAITSPGTMVRIEAVRTSHSGSPHFHIYHNGALVGETATASTIPYKVYFYFRTIYGGYFQFGDIVIGDTEEKNVVSTIPDTWFVAKDVFNSAFTGLYSATDTQVYTNKMHCTYATDDGSATVTVTDITTGTVVNTTTVSSYAGIITYNLTTMLFNSGAPYGQYRVQISGSTASDTFWYKAIATSGTSVQWDDTDYSDGDTATITFSISEGNWDSEDYSYCVEVWDESLNEIESWAVAARPVNATKTIDVNTANFGTSGTFYCVLTATDTSSGEEMLLTYDDASVLLPGSGEVIVEGTTYDATTNLTLTSCTVVATQMGVDHSTTSDGTTGAYEVSDLVTDWSLGMNASKTGYLGYLVSFTPYDSGTYTVDIPLVPSGGPAPDGYSNATTAYYNSTTDGTALGGICYEGPYWTLGEGCNVTVSNSTWSTSCTTGAGGWYQCNNIGAGGTYALSCSKSGYTDYTTSCSLTEGCFNREDCTIESSTDLNVECRELTSEGLITGTACTVTLSTGESCDTTNGTAVFSGLAYGYYEIAASAEGYYPGATSAVMDEGKTVSCYLQEKTEGGSGIAYAPKTVRFTVQNIWGKKISDCDVECQGYETTAGSFAWLYSLFGIDANETPIATAHMEGQTDYKGDINFLMLEPVKYVCNFTKVGEINKSVEIYPKDDYYLILAEDYGNESWFDGGVDINSAINITVATSEVNATHAWINLTYRDSTGLTTGGTCYLNQTNATVGGAPITLSTCALSSGCEDGCNCTFLVQNYPGEGYILQVDPTHSVWDFERTFTVVFPEEIVNPLGLSGMELALIAAGCVLFAGALFSAISAPMAPLIMSFVGWICFALGWLGAVAVPAFAGLVLASVLAIAYLIAIGSHKERWT
jgi:hypothetical protein